jgi:hypothetical protein
MTALDQHVHTLTTSLITNTYNQETGEISSSEEVKVEERDVETTTFEQDIDRVTCEVADITFDAEDKEEEEEPQFFVRPPHPIISFMQASELGEPFLFIIL